MRIDHLFLVAVMQNGTRFPIIGIRPRIDETPVRAAQRAYPFCKIVHDTRPWLLLSGDERSTEKWIQTNRMPPDRVRVVRGPDDIPEKPAEWQLAAVGYWLKKPHLRTAMIRMLMLTTPVGEQTPAEVSCD